MENWQLALLMLAAILVGVTIPMVIQYQTTLRSLNRLITDNERDIRRAVVDAAQLSANLNRISKSLESNAGHLTTLLEAVEDVTEGVKRIRGTLKTASVVGAAVAPAMSAVLRALQGTGPAPGANVAPSYEDSSYLEGEEHEQEQEQEEMIDPASAPVAAPTNGRMHRVENNGELRNGRASL